MIINNYKQSQPNPDVLLKLGFESNDDGFNDDEKEFDDGFNYDQEESKNENELLTHLEETDLEDYEIEKDEQ